MGARVARVWKEALMSLKRRGPVLVVVAGLVGLIVLGLAQAAPSGRNDDPSVPAACTLATSWKVNGNCGMVPATNFLGTTDAQPLVIRTHKIERLRVDPGGNVGVGTASPANRLAVDIGNGPVDSGVTIQGTTTTFGDMGLRIDNLGAGGAEWYLDVTNGNSVWGGGKLAFVKTPLGTPPTMVLTSGGKVGI